MRIQGDARHVLLALALAAITWPLGASADTTERHGYASGWTEGLARGIGMTVLRPLVGVYELVTAPFPAPENFEPILQPEYSWSYFGDGGSGVAQR